MDIQTNQEMVRDALRRAFIWGETHWLQADSQSYADNRKAFETLAKFKAWADETAAALSREETP